MSSLSCKILMENSNIGAQGNIFQGKKVAVMVSPCDNVTEQSQPVCQGMDGKSTAAEHCPSGPSLPPPHHHPGFPKPCTLSPASHGFLEDLTGTFK